MRMYKGEAFESAVWERDGVYRFRYGLIHWRLIETYGGWRFEVLVWVKKLGV